MICKIRKAYQVYRKRMLQPQYFVVGYPKVGNTWFQIMLRKALAEYYALSDDWISKILNSTQEVPRGVTRIEVTHNMPNFPLGSYKDIVIDNRRFKNKKVILLIRDPKDVLVSLYMQYVYREKERMYHGDLSQMVYDEMFGIDKYIKFYNRWYEESHLPKEWILIRYEDMKKDVVYQMRRALYFLGMKDITDSFLQKVVQYGSFANMRTMEINNTLGLSTLAPSPNKSENSFKVRRGKVGGYIDYFDTEIIHYIDQKIKKELPVIFQYNSY